MGFRTDMEQFMMLLNGEMSEEEYWEYISQDLTPKEKASEERGA